VRVEVVSHLGGDDDAFAPPGEGAREQLVRAAVAVGVGAVEGGDAQVEGAVQQRHGLVVREVSPPPGGQRPQPEAHLADGDVGAGIGAVLHPTQSVLRLRSVNGSELCIMLAALFLRVQLGADPPYLDSCNIHAIVLRQNPRNGRFEALADRVR